MKLNTRDKPRILRKLEAIIPRLQPAYQKTEEVKYELAKRRRGYTGELKVDYYTDFLADRFTILHDICLRIRGKTMQLDTVVLTPHATFIIDSKNYRNTITIDTVLEQFIQDDGKVESGSLYPIYQMELQQFNLQQWLKMKDLPGIPIYYFIAISEPETIVKVVGDKEKLSKIVTHAAGLVKKILNKDKQLANSDAIKFEHEKIGRIIKNASRDYDKDVMKEFGITFNDLQSGVQCLECGQIGMMRIYGKWECENCNHHSRYAHKKAINDFLLLEKPWITNKICRHWLQLPNKSTATRILKDCKFIYNPKVRRWYPPKKY